MFAFDSNWFGYISSSGWVSPLKKDSKKIIDKKQNTLKDNKVIVFASNVVKNTIAKWNEVQEIEETPVFSMNRNQYAMAV